MLGFSVKCLPAWPMISLLGLFAACVRSAEYPSSLATSQLPLSSLRAPRLASFCTQLNPSLVPFCSHVTYPVFHSRLLSDGEWQVSGACVEAVALA